jgi:hypothetical protein
MHIMEVVLNDLAYFLTPVRRSKLRWALIWPISVIAFALTRCMNFVIWRGMAVFDRLPKGEYLMSSFFRVSEVIRGLFDISDVGHTELSSRLEAAAQRAFDLNMKWFGIPRDRDRPFELLFGPRSGLSSDWFGKSYLICLRQSYTTDEELYASLFHEMFHRVTHFHPVLRRNLWIDEMLAYMSTQHTLEIENMNHYARMKSMAYRHSPKRLTIDQLSRARRSPYFMRLFKPYYPEGFAATVAHLGETLEEIVGWEAMCQIVRFNTIPEWIESLPEKQKRYVSELLL